jgi:hypothetical protein
MHHMHHMLRSPGQSGILGVGLNKVDGNRHGKICKNRSTEQFLRCAISSPLTTRCRQFVLTRLSWTIAASETFGDGLRYRFDVAEGRKV